MIASLMLKFGAWLVKRAVHMQGGSVTVYNDGQRVLGTPDDAVETHRRLAKDLAAKWIEREREQMQTILEKDGTPHRVSSLRSGATHACRRELQEAFGLVSAHNA